MAALGARRGCGSLRNLQAHFPPWAQDPRPAAPGCACASWRARPQEGPLPASGWSPAPQTELTTNEWLSQHLPMDGQELGSWS